MSVAGAIPGRPSVPPRLLHLTWVFFTGLGLVAFPYLLWASGGSFGYDAWAYAHVDLENLYAGYDSLSTFGAFRYSPPVAMVFAVLGAIPWPTFLALWTGCLLLALYYIGRRRHTLALLGVPFVAMDLHYGNVNLLLAAAIVAADRFPALWAVVILTKPSSAIALLWYVPRRRWGPILLAIGATLAVVAPTVVARPDLWRDWLALLLDNATVSQPIPLALRLAIALPLALWGGATGRHWTLPASAAIAVPSLWLNQLSLWVALFPDLLAFIRSRREGEVAGGR